MPAGHAALVTHTITGTVTQVDPALTSQFSVGQTVSYQFTFDDATPDTSSLPEIGEYLGALKSAFGTIGTYSFNETTINSNMFVVNNHPTANDQIAVNPFPITGPSVNGYGPSQIQLWFLLDVTDTALGTTSLSVLPPDLTKFGTQFNLIFFVNSSSIRAAVHWHITSWQVSSADLSITKTDGVGSAFLGGTTSYTIVATNAGPSAVTGATVADTFPAACASVSYTSVAAGGATGNTTGPASGNINDTALNLPVGASVTYTATCTIALTATGTLVNTATIASGVSDPNPDNNSATDTDTLIPLATLTIQLDAPGSAPTAFGFTTVGLTPAAFSLQHGQTQIFTNLIPGQTYVVNDQPPPPGWVLDEVLCSVPAPQCVISSITLTPTAGQDVTGTFRFRRLAGVAEGIPVFSVWGLSALIGLFGLALARLRRQV